MTRKIINWLLPWHRYTQSCLTGYIRRESFPQLLKSKNPPLKGLMLGTPVILWSGHKVRDPLLYCNTGSKAKVQKAIQFVR